MAVVGGQTGVRQGCDGAPVFTLELINWRGRSETPVQTCYAALATHIPNCLSKTRRLPPPHPHFRSHSRSAAAAEGGTARKSITSQAAEQLSAATAATRKITFVPQTKSPRRKIKRFPPTQRTFEIPNLRRCTAALRADARALSFLRP